MLMMRIRQWLQGGSLFYDACHSRREALREWKAFISGHDYRYRSPEQARFEAVAPAGESWY